MKLVYIAVGVLIVFWQVEIVDAQVAIVQELTLFILTVGAGSLPIIRGDSEGVFIAVAKEL